MCVNMYIYIYTLYMQCIFTCTNISEKYFCFESLSLLIHQQLGCLDQEPHVISAAKGWQLPRADTAWHSGTHSWDQSGTQLLEKKQANNISLTTISNVDILYPFLVKQWFLSVLRRHDNRTWSTMVQRVMGMIPTVFTKIHRQLNFKGRKLWRMGFLPLEHQNSSTNLGLIRGPQDACLYTTGIQFVSIHSHPQSSFDQVIHLIASQHPRLGTCLCRMKGLGGHVQSSGGPAPPETSTLPGDWLTDSFGRSFSHFLCERDLKNEKLMRRIKWRSSLRNVFDVDSKENKTCILYTVTFSCSLLFGQTS